MQFGVTSHDLDFRLVSKSYVVFGFHVALDWRCQIVRLASDFTGRSKRHFSSRVRHAAIYRSTTEMVTQAAARPALARDQSEA